MTLRRGSLHPLAWWLWALGLAVAASRSTNPLVLGLIVAVVGYVVASCRPAEQWARGFRAYLILALSVVAIRTVFHIVFGGGAGGTVLLRLPEIDLPAWVAGVRLGGPVSAEGLVAACYDGLRLATLLICVGAAVTLSDPRQLLRTLPGALYELGLIVVVAISVAPQLVEAALRVRRAQALRGGTARGLRAVRAVAMPVLAMALDRAVALAAAMDARGYGRRGPASPAARHLTAALLLAGLLGVAVGSYGLLDAEAARTGPGWSAVWVGTVAAVGGLALGAHRGGRTRYHRGGWDLRSVLVAVSGVLGAISVLRVARTDPTAILTSAYPLTLPRLALFPAVVLLLALTPAGLAPTPVRPGPAAPARRAVPA